MLDLSHLRLERFAAPLARSLRGWATHDHTPGGRSLKTTEGRILHLANAHCAQGDEVSAARGATRASAHKVTEPVSLQYSGYEVVLREDGTYEILDTCGG